MAAIMVALKILVLDPIPYNAELNGLMEIIFTARGAFGRWAYYYGVFRSNNRTEGVTFLETAMMMLDSENETSI